MKFFMIYTPIMKSHDLKLRNLMAAISTKQFQITAENKVNMFVFNFSVYRSVAYHTRPYRTGTAQVYVTSLKVHDLQLDFP